MEFKKEFTAGIIIIGNEILSGRTVDKNTSFIALWLNDRGISVEEVRVIPDKEKVIIDTVNELKKNKLKFEVFVTLKKEVLDPQGKAVENALSDIGLNAIKNIRQGKYFTLEVNENDENKASDLVKSSCEKLLANQTIENFKFNKI